MADLKYDVPRVPVLHPHSKRQVGYIQGNTFYGNRSESGIVRHPKGISFPVEHLQLFARKGVEWINIRVPPRRYITTLAMFRQNGEKYPHSAEPQYLLRIGWWSVNGHPPTAKRQTHPPSHRQQELISYD